MSNSWKVLFSSLLLLLLLLFLEVNFPVANLLVHPLRPPPPLNVGSVFKAAGKMLWLTIKK